MKLCPRSTKRLDAFLIFLLAFLVSLFLAFSSSENAEADTPTTPTAKRDVLHDIASDVLSNALHVRLADDHPLMHRAAGAALDLSTAINLQPETSHFREDVFLWSFYEAGWLADPPGSNDQGSACGIGQVHSPELVITGATCERVRKDRVLGYRVMLVLLRQLEIKCGSRLAALSAYSTDGTCHTFVPGVVKQRCAMLQGGC